MMAQKPEGKDHTQPTSCSHAGSPYPSPSFSHLGFLTQQVPRTQGEGTLENHRVPLGSPILSQDPQG